jgi:uncharacterized membrane protein
VVVACLLALFAYSVLPFNWSWNYNFLFGSIMCATDPVSVVSLLKSAKASSSLSTIIAGGIATFYCLLISMCSFDFKGIYYSVKHQSPC